MYADKYRLLIFCILTLGVSVGYGQKKTKAQLQREKQQNVEKIKEVERILSETTAKKTNTLGELTALNQRILEQEKLVSSIRQEISLLDVEITENKDIIDALEKDLKELKKEYAAMLYAAQKADNSVTRLTFLFSAPTFDQLVMRLRYMDQYGKARALQAEMIIQVQEELSAQNKSIQDQRAEKKNLLAEVINENGRLAELKEKQDRLVKALEKQEKKLKRDLDETREAIAKLDRLISEVIKEEMAREAAAAKSTRNVSLSANFEENRQKLPWPVASGFISQKFGRQNHPVLKGIVIENEGVHIQTRQNEKVKCVFEGEVTNVAFVPALGSAVLIKHGEYFTVYAGLKEVYVKAGQKVVVDQEIGRVISNAEGISELRFQIFKETKPLDPQLWLRNNM